jgi:hypothetical protein
VAENLITLIVEGIEREKGDVRLDVFLAELRLLHQALAHVDEKIANGERNSHFAVVGLSHSSPSAIAVEPRANRGRQDVSKQIVSTLAHVIESIDSGNIGEDIDYELLMDLRGLVAPVGNQLRSATLKVNGGAYDLTREFAMKIELHLEQQEVCIGTMEGMLERINVHDDANMFTIYPDVGPKSVSCYFPVELVDVALGAAKRRVAVTGTMRYRKFAPYPYQIRATDMDIYDLEDALPTFDDLRGIAPDATGDERAADFIAKFRDGWV